ncbi:MAG: NADP-dependent oxidoreductase, partial [Proteobacteria bacterium]|nr:NADP-dependent oxidoreductase [Pseudomonadota bacterium]
HRRIILSKHPQGAPTEDCFVVEEGPVPTPGPDQFLVRTTYLSVDPFLRLLMNPQSGYGPAAGRADVMVGGLLGEVIESNNAHYPVGETVEGLLGWQTHAISDGSGNPMHNPEGIIKCDLSIAPDVVWASVLGRPGMTSYFALLRDCKPQAGETAVISGGAGAVGSVAGQIAKVKGCRVVGIAGSDEKTKWLTDELGFDSAINYKTTEDIGDALSQACPDGIDIHFDNVGGPIAKAINDRLNGGARTTRVGVISHYNDNNDGKPWIWPEDERMFIVHDWVTEYAAARRDMAAWIAEGRLKYRVTIVDGFENTPSAFMGVLGGDNIGKMLVRVR